MGCGALPDTNSFLCLAYYGLANGRDVWGGFDAMDTPQCVPGDVLWT